MDKQEFSVGICTSRRNLLLSLLLMISEQNIWPKQIVIVSTYHFDISTLTTQQKDIRELSEYSQISVFIIKHRNISNSRNIVLENIRSKWFFFIDDDVVINDSYLFSSLINAVHVNKLTAISPLVKPTHINRYSEFLFRLYHYNVKSHDKISILHEHPLSLMLIDHSFINRHKIKFKAKLPSGEDIDFTRRISENGGKIAIALNQSIFHHYEHSIVAFTKKCFWYCSGIIKKDSISLYNYGGFIPNRLVNFVFYPVFIIIKIFSNANSSSVNNIFPAKYQLFLPSLIFHTIYFFSVLSIPKYRKICKEVFIKKLNGRFLNKY